MVMTSSPDFLSKVAKVRRKVWGLHGSPVEALSLLNIEIIPHCLSPQTLPTGTYWLNHSLRYRSDSFPNGANASFRPLPIILIVLLSQSMSCSRTLVNSDNLNPLSVSRAIIALSRTLSTFSIKMNTCSAVRLGNISFASLGAFMLFMGLGKSKVSSRQL